METKRNKTTAASSGRAEASNAVPHLFFFPFGPLVFESLVRRPRKAFAIGVSIIIFSSQFTTKNVVNGHRWSRGFWNRRNRRPPIPPPCFFFFFFTRRSVNVLFFLLFPFLDFLFSVSPSPERVSCSHRNGTVERRDDRSRTPNFSPSFFLSSFFFGKL